MAVIFCGYLAKHLYGLHMAFILAMGACMVWTGRIILSWLRWVGWEASSLLCKCKFLGREGGCMDM